MGKHGEEEKGGGVLSSLTIERARRVLGLGAEYSPSELTRAYHRKLFEFHPDTSGEADPEAGRRLDELILARRILERRLEYRERGGGELAAQSGGIDPRPRSGSGSRDYLLYRQALSLFGEALDRYWRERLKFSQMPAGSPELRRFHERIREARKLFAAVLEGFPGGIWTADAVEHIARINSWLRGEDGSLGNGQ